LNYKWTNLKNFENFVFPFTWWLFCRHLFSHFFFFLAKIFVEIVKKREGDRLVEKTRWYNVYIYNVYLGRDQGRDFIGGGFFVFFVEKGRPFLLRNFLLYTGRCVCVCVWNI
jgi:hypothetical protein